MSDNGVVTTTEVEIFGATYVLRSGQDPEYLKTLAGEVDRRMRELADHLNQVDPECTVRGGHCQNRRRETPRRQLTIEQVILHLREAGVPPLLPT